VNDPSRAQIRVWQIDIAQAAHEYPRFWEALSEKERERAKRFHFEVDRRRFVLSRGNLRRRLAQELCREERDISFRIGEAGKPELSHPAGTGLFFNVSHSGALVLFALARRQVGVDVEQWRDGVNVRQLAQRFYSEVEWEELRRLEGSEQEEAFFRCWTRKEAIVKAVGKGLLVPLSSFYAGTDDSEERVVETGDGRNWKVCSWTPRAGYSAAVAADAGAWTMSLFPVPGSR
jgi:4'-phosphopantetheinyl transferase